MPSLSHQCISPPFPPNLLHEVHRHQDHHRPDHHPEEMNQKLFVYKLKIIIIIQDIDKLYEKQDMFLKKISPKKKKKREPEGDRESLILHNQHHER